MLYQTLLPYLLLAGGIFRTNLNKGIRLQVFGGCVCYEGNKVMQNQYAIIYPVYCIGMVIFLMNMPERKNAGQR